MNDSKSIQPILLVEKPVKKAKVKKAVTKQRKGYSENNFLGIPFEKNPEGKITSEILDHPKEKPVNIQQCYNCEKLSAQPNVNGKVQHFIWIADKHEAVPVPPNCPDCGSKRMGAPKEMIEAGYENGEILLSPEGQRLDVTRDDGSNILSVKQSYLVKNSDMSEDEIDQVVMYDSDEDGTMEAFDNALPMSNFIRYGYQVRDDKDKLGSLSLHGDMTYGLSKYNLSKDELHTIKIAESNGARIIDHSKFYGLNHNKTIKDNMCRRLDYHTKKGTLYQDNTCFKHFHVYPHRSLSYFEIQKLMKEGFNAKRQYRKICDASPNGYKSKEAQIQIEKRDIARMRLKSGFMNAGPSEGSWSKIPKDDYKKDYEKDTMDREFKSLVIERELGVNVESLDTYRIAKKVERMNELIVN